MTVQAQQSRGLARFWPVWVALLLGLIHPVIAVVFAVGAAVVRRDDRRVMVTLLVIAVLWLFFLSLFKGVAGGGWTIGG